MPGRIVHVLVGVGDRVEAHQGLVVIEAMQMQNEIRAPRAGRIARVEIGESGAVSAGQLLFLIEDWPEPSRSAGI
ncbi:MAG: acetyl-CoA carboxylase biotin carboxyl carrier protein subunit [Acidobacteriota bacterium]